MAKDIGDAVSQVQQAYTTAVFERSVPALMRLYDPKVRVFDAWGVWEYDGADAWQVAVEGWLNSLGEERVKVRFDDTRILGTPDLAIVSMVVSYTGTSAGGEELRTLQNRMTWGFRTAGHNLRIIHEHTSAPIGFEDMKAILQRATPAA